MTNDNSSSAGGLGLNAEIPTMDRFASMLRDAQLRAAESPRIADPSTDQIPDAHQPPPELSDALVGFKYVKLLSEGGQGVVYQYQHAQTGRLIAVKVLRHSYLSSRSERERFEREIQTLAKLQNPNIVGFIPFHNNTKLQFFCMEFIDGPPIDQFVFQHRPGIRKVVEMFVRICDAVQAAHQQLVLHRDLKPANILVTPDDQPHILDFGLSRDLDAEMRGLQDRLSMPQHMVGTLLYSSPEQVDEDFGPVDMRTDVYALGLILYELLCGSKPYPLGGTRKEVCASITSRTPASLRKQIADTPSDKRWTRGTVSDDLERVVLKALEKEKARRYQSVEAFKEDLLRYLRGEPVTAKSASYGYVLRKLITRYKLASGLAAALLLTVLAGSISISVISQQKLRIMRISQEASAINGLLNQGRYLTAQGNFSDGRPALEKVLELSRASKSNDSTIKSNAFDAAYTLSLQLVRREEFQASEQYLADMEHIANESYQQSPDDPAALRQMALFHFVQGEKYRLQRKPKSATSNYEKSLSFREKLYSTDPNNRNFELELIKAIDGLGSCFSAFKNTPAALETLSRARSIINDYLLKHPEDFDFKLELAANEGLFAAAHIRCDTEEHDRLAKDLISRQKELLESLIGDQRGAYRGADLNNLLMSIPRNLKKIADNETKRPPADKKPLNSNP